MTDQTVPTSEVTDAHVRAYRHAFDIAASGPWVGSDECIRAGLAAVFTMAAPLSSPPSAGEAREVPVGSVLDRAIGFTILRTEMHYEPPGAHEVYVQVPENDLNSQDPWGVFEEVAERNAKHEKDRAETESWMDLDDGHPWTVAALVPVTEAELEAYGNPRPVSPPLPTEPGAVGTATVRGKEGVTVYRFPLLEPDRPWVTYDGGIYQRWSDSDLSEYVVIVDGVAPASAGVAAPDPAKEA